MELKDRHCVPCRGGVPPLQPSQIRILLEDIPAWSLNARGHLEREYAFPDFAGALAFTARVGAVAEAEGHHPDVHLYWGKVVLEVWTHKIGGLTESDFILAAKADAAYG